MKKSIYIICALCLSLVFHCGCSSDSTELTQIEAGGGFKLSLNGAFTRSAESEAILDDMRLFCFTQGSTPLSGDGGSWNSLLNHYLTGVTRTGMTLHAGAVRAGFWDLVMVSGAGADFSPPLSTQSAGASLMYTYNPGAVQLDGSKSKAHEIWHRALRLPEIVADISNNAACAVTRNVTMIKVVVDRGVDISTSATDHTFELHGVPDKISWAGTLLRTVSPGVYQTSTSAPDVLTQPLTGRFTFVDNGAVETGTYKSDTLTFIVPAHREADFWANATTKNNNVKDTLTHKMSVAVSFTKASGGKFTKTVQIPIAATCNNILLLKLKMEDVNLEIIPSVTPWENENVDGDFTAAYLNVSNLKPIVHDGSVSRLYFWSNQPADSVYITKAGSGIPDVDAVFDRIAGATAVNRHYDPATNSGYIDIASLNLAASQSDVKIYLNASGLRREITVKRAVTPQALKKITTPYVGTFHRWNQTGERVVTWSQSGAWTAYVDDPTGAGTNVVIDRFAGSALAEGSLYGTTPADAELSPISNDATSVCGMNTVYFRAGWKTKLAAATTEPRYATITVRQGTNDPNGTVIQKIYLRQGEKASVVYARTGAGKFSPYNLTATTSNTALAERGGIFTDYPSQSGAYFQWMDDKRPRFAYAASGAVAAPWNPTPPFFEFYWTELTPGLDATHETCPTGYRRVRDGATSGEPTGTSEMRESLWDTPTLPSASNTLGGFYADGFFDRQAIGASATAVANSTAGSADKLAYRGRLFYNAATNASLFFPAAGQRNTTTGALENLGLKGYYWTSSSTVSTTVPTGSAAYATTSLRNTAVTIRCVAE